MPHISPSRSRLATIVAALALTVALVGAGLSSADAVSRALSKAKVGKIATKKANAVLEQRQGALNVNSAKTADSAATAQRAETAGSAENATNAVNAEQAQNAVNAQSAATVGGVELKEIDYTAATATPKRTIFAGSGLTLQAECAAGIEVAVTATTIKPDSTIYTSYVDSDVDVDNPFTADQENGAFDPGDELQLLIDGTADSGIATFAYHAKDGSSVTGTIGTDEVQAGGQPAICEVRGHVMAS